VRYEVRGHKVAESTGGPIRTVLRSHVAWLNQHKPRVRNAIVRAALFDAGVMWIERFMWKRFSAYAKRLGYKGATNGNRSQVKATVDGRRIFSDAPFVDTGEFAIRAIPGARVVATATSNRQRIRILIPSPHPMRSKTRAQFVRVPADEVRAIAAQVDRSLGKAHKDAAGG
jgi:hypothetical protein